MDILGEFYKSPAELQRCLVESISRNLRRIGVCDSNLDDLCELPDGTWGIIEREPVNLDSDIFLTICYALELEIEDVMPLEVSEEQISRVCAHMKHSGHGVVACTGRPTDSSTPPTGGSRANEIPYEDQAELYIRLRALDELDEYLAANAAS